MTVAQATSGAVVRIPEAEAGAVVRIPEAEAGAVVRIPVVGAGVEVVGIGIVESLVVVGVVADLS